MKFQKQGAMLVITKFTITKNADDVLPVLKFLKYKSGEVTEMWLAKTGSISAKFEAKISIIVELQPMGGGGGTLRISGWGCAARTLEPLAYTRASFSWIFLPYTRVNSWFP